MAELVIQMVDRVNPSSAKLDAGCLKRGDVIDICADGWEWSERELTNPNWRIIKLPGIPVETLLDLLEAQLAADRTFVRKRSRYLDIDSLPSNIKNKITNATQPLTFSVSERTALNAIRKTKTALQVTVG
jgi:hypothetical protein